MKACSAWILLLFWLMTVLSARAQFDPEKVCRMENGRLIFTLDKRWTDSQRKEISATFDLDSVLMSWAIEGKTSITQNEIVWTTRRLDNNRVELSKEQSASSSISFIDDKIILVEDQWIKLASAAERESVPYGVNRLTRNTVVNLTENRIRFFLPGYNEAGKVYISGSFNDWSTLQNPLRKCDSGWTTTLEMKPGKYSYKFIIDGKWTNDPFNKIREDDTYDGYNNIFFCYNYKFVLNGFPSARKVFLTASFNDWNEDELRMIRFKGTWVLPLYLREGTHVYKFIVDGMSVNDPLNKATIRDDAGNRNSIIGFGDTLYFRLSGYPDARKVAIAGSFNSWHTDELFMEKTISGWEMPYVLAPGNYEYKFLVDGNWMPDPGNPVSTGSGGFTNSVIAVDPNYIFRLEQYPKAEKVILAGSFNGWNSDGYRMVLKDGVWQLPMFLNPGKYSYKFVVDGKWITDPSNKLWEDNRYGTGNSVLWIEP